MERSGETGKGKRNCSGLMWRDSNPGDQKGARQKGSRRDCEKTPAYRITPSGEGVVSKVHALDLQDTNTLESVCIRKRAERVIRALDV